MAINNLKEIQQSAVGYTLTLQTGIALDDTTDMLLVLKVNDTRKEIVLDETNKAATMGDVVYTTVEGDLDEVGTYSAQLIDITTGVYLPSKIFKFKVVANIE